MKLDESDYKAMMCGDTYIPDYLRPGVLRYIEQGITPGSFIGAIICNDLQATIATADPGSLIYIPTIAKWFFNHAPFTCHGNESKYHGWIESHRRRAEFKAV